MPYTDARVMQIALGSPNEVIRKVLSQFRFFLKGDDRRRFEALHGTIVCRELLGVDLSTMEGQGKAIKENLFHTLCPVVVRDAAQILLEISG
jgi:hypothetical protein